MAVLYTQSIAVAVLHAVHIARQAVVQRRRHTLALKVKSHRQAVVPVVTGTYAPYHRQLPSVHINRNRVLRLRLDDDELAIQFGLGLKGSTEVNGMFTKCMEELCASTEADVADAE